MTRKERFIIAVQAAAIVADIQDGRSIAGPVITQAFWVSDGAINAEQSDLGDMVKEYIRYQYQTRLPGQPGIKKPEWLRFEDEKYG